MKIFSSLKVTPLSNLYDSLELCEAFRLDNYEHIKPCYLLYCVLFLVHKKSGIFSALVILFYKRYF